MKWRLILVHKDEMVELDIRNIKPFTFGHHGPPSTPRLTAETYILILLLLLIIEADALLILLVS